MKHAVDTQRVANPARERVAIARKRTLRRRSVMAALAPYASCRHWDYQRLHQVGSHIILQTEAPAPHRISILVYKARYILRAEFEKTANRVFEQHAELFKKLAQ